MTRFEEGRYPVHCSLEVESTNALSNLVNKTVARHRSMIEKTQFGAAFTALETSTLHMSLSRNCFVDVQFVDLLCSRLKELAAQLKKDHCAQQIMSVKYLCSDDRQRSYLTLVADRFSLAGQQLMSLIAQIDKVYSALDLPLYHANPTPHISIGFIDQDIESVLAAVSATGEPERLTSDELTLLQETVEDETVLNRAASFEITAVVVAAGQRVERFPIG